MRKTPLSQTVSYRGARPELCTFTTKADGQDVCNQLAEMPIDEILYFLETLGTCMIGVGADPTSLTSEDKVRKYDLGFKLTNFVTVSRQKK